MEECYDVIIIGGGPAGLAATIYAGRAGRKALMIKKESFGGRINDTREVRSYPGLIFDSGADLMQKLEAHAQSYAINVFKRIMITGLETMEDGAFLVHTKHRGDLIGNSVILDMGVKPRVLGIPNEIELVGYGVAYCATCDAEFFRGKEIYILGAGDQAIEESGYLTHSAKKATVIVLHEKGHLDCNEIVAAEAYANPKIEFVWNTTLQEILGNEEVRGLIPENVASGEIQEVCADGTFFFVGTVLQTAFVQNVVAHDAKGYTLASEKEETSVPGIYAVGGCAQTFLRQVVTIAADGAIAATASERYCRERNQLKNTLTPDSGRVAFLLYNPYESSQIEQVTQLEEVLQDDYTVIRQDITSQTLLYQLLHMDGTLSSAMLEHGKLIKKNGKEAQQNHRMEKCNMGQSYVSSHGASVYDPQKCWNGYTIVPLINDGVLLFDMNGNKVRRWNVYAMPPKLSPGGYVMGLSGYRHPGYGMQDGVNLIETDYDGNTAWGFGEFEHINDPGRDCRWTARQHHDYQREGNPAGYYMPGMDAKPLEGNVLILVHRTIKDPAIPDKRLLDGTMIEVDWEGNILWKWPISDHFDELDFDGTAKSILARDPNTRSSDSGVGDYLYVNCMNYLGPNKQYEHEDMRFKPDNVILDCREASILATLDKESGKIVRKTGPDFNATPELRKLGWVIGQHHFYMIPKGLPGEGNLTVFDNGGWGGYGAPNPGSCNGSKNALRDYSRMLEFNPITLEVVWKLTPEELVYAIPTDTSKFYSPCVSNVQRLPDGNTPVTEGSDGRIIEVTVDYEIAWEWIPPYYTHNETGPKNNMTHRGYRYLYSYVPQEPTPTEIAIPRIDNTTLRMPNAGALGAKTVIDVEGTLSYYQNVALCVVTNDEEGLSQREKVFSVDTAVFEPISGMVEWKDKVVKQREKPVLVLFGAERYVYCEVLHPVLGEALQKEFANNFLIRYVDTDANKDIVAACHVQGIPVMAVYHNGEEVRCFHGEHNYNDVCDFLDAVFA